MPVHKYELEGGTREVRHEIHSNAIRYGYTCGAGYITSYSVGYSHYDFDFDFLLLVLFTGGGGGGAAGSTSGTTSSSKTNFFTTTFSFTSPPSGASAFKTLPSVSRRKDYQWLHDG